MITKIEKWEDVCEVLEHFGVPYSWVQEQTGRAGKWIIYLSSEGWGVDTAIQLLSAYAYLRKIDNREFLWFK